MEELITEVLALVELKEKFEGTVQPNDQNHQKSYQADQCQTLLQGVQLCEGLAKKKVGTELKSKIIVRYSSAR